MGEAATLDLHENLSRSVEAERYAYWAAKLAGEDPDPPADRTILPCGFWRLRSGKPMAVWIDDDGHWAVVGFSAEQATLTERQMEEMAERGGFGAAVDEPTYRRACVDGYWPDSDGPARDLMNALQNIAERTAEAADQIGTKLVPYPDYTLTKKLRAELAKIASDLDKHLRAYDEREMA